MYVAMALSVMLLQMYVFNSAIVFGNISKTKHGSSVIMKIWDCFTLFWSSLAV